MNTGSKHTYVNFKQIRNVEGKIEMSQIHPSFKNYIELKTNGATYGATNYNLILRNERRDLIARVESSIFTYQCGAQIIAGAETRYATDLNDHLGLIYYYLKEVMRYNFQSKNLALFSTPKSDREPMYRIILAFNKFANQFGLQTIDEVYSWYNKNSSNDVSLFTYNKQLDDVKNWITKDIDKALGGGGETKEEYDAKIAKEERRLSKKYRAPSVGSTSYMSNAIDNTVTFLSENPF